MTRLETAIYRATVGGDLASGKSSEFCKGLTGRLFAGEQLCSGPILLCGCGEHIDSNNTCRKCRRDARVRTTQTGIWLKGTFREVEVRRCRWFAATQESTATWTTEDRLRIADELRRCQTAIRNAADTQELSTPYNEIASTTGTTPKLVKDVADDMCCNYYFYNAGGTCPVCEQSKWSRKTTSVWSPVQRDMQEIDSLCGSMDVTLTGTTDLPAIDHQLQRVRNAFADASTADRERAGKICDALDHLPAEDRCRQLHATRNMLQSQLNQRGAKAGLQVLNRIIDIVCTDADEPETGT